MQALEKLEAINALKNPEALPLHSVYNVTSIYTVTHLIILLWLSQQCCVIFINYHFPN